MSTALCLIEVRAPSSGVTPVGAMPLSIGRSHEDKLGRGHDDTHHQPDI